MLSLREIPSPMVYESSERTGVTVIGVAGSLSILAVLIYATRWKTRPKGQHYTHVFAYFVSLLIANTLQAVGAVMNVRWVTEGAVIPGAFCGAQGAIKNAGNVGTALWSFMLALHLFKLLFMRVPTTKIGLILTLAVGWTAVLSVPLIGATAIQTAQRGPYFSVSGLWCWITSEYPREQTFLEYFFEFLSAGFGFILYSTILLRVRGNLVFVDGRWRVRFVPRCDRWQLALGRDAIDSSMIRVAAQMVWYPVAYSVILFPVSMSRLTEFAGRTVPVWAVILSDIIFNLTGFVNVFLMVTTRKLLPDGSFLPEFTTPRKEINPSSPEAVGITPFPLGEPEGPISRPMAARYPTRAESLRNSRASFSTVNSFGSETPLVRQESIQGIRPFSLRLNSHP